MLMNILLSGNVPMPCAVLSCSVVSDSLRPYVWTVTRRASLSLGFSRQEYWSGLPFPPPGALPNPGIEPRSPALAGRFFTSWVIKEAPVCQYFNVNMKVAQSCPTLCDPTDYTVPGIPQTRILEWVAFPFSRGSSQPRVELNYMWILYQESSQGSLPIF